MLLIWQIVVTARHIPTMILPAPFDIAAELWRALPALLRHAVPATLDSLTAFALGSAGSDEDEQQTRAGMSIPPLLWPLY